MRPPYHEGELAVQRRAGVEAMAAKIGRGIHAELPSAAAEFLAAQRFAVIASTDHAGSVWASPLTGPPGFLHARDAHTLEVAAAPAPTDPLRDALSAGSPIGMIAIDFANRRRARVNGGAEPLPGGGFLLRVEQAYANCPKYIRRREPGGADPPPPGARRVSRAPQLSPAQSAWIASSDTFFVATAHPEHGADASHRGGDPGFVHVLDPGNLVWPDYAGNAMFQTLGNLTSNPACGLLFVDFERGASLQLSGSARVRWDEATGSGMVGAERLVDFRVEHVVESDGAVFSGWQEHELSPYNPR